MTGPVPLTPIQRWFFAAGAAASPHHFNQAVLLRAARAALDAAALAGGACAQLLRHHDALRLRFVRDGDGWRQAHASAPAPRGASRAASTSRRLPAAAARRRWRRPRRGLQASLDLAAGPLLRGPAVDLGPGGRAAPAAGRPSPGRRRRLLAHPAGGPGGAYGQLRRGAARGAAAEDHLVPGAGPSGWPSTRESDALAAGAALLAGRAGARRAAAGGPPEGEANDGRLGADASPSSSTRRRRARCSRRCPAAYRTQINDVLLAALARGARRLDRRAALLVDLEGHGREELFERRRPVAHGGLVHHPLPGAAGRWRGDARPGRRRSRRSRSSCAPSRARHRLRAAALPARAGAARQRARARCRAGGAASTTWASSTRLLAAERRCFAAGRGAGGGRAAAAGDAAHAPPGDRRPGGRRPAAARPGPTAGRGTTARRRSSAGRRASCAALRALIAHCRSPEAGGYTPSDFPLAGLRPGGARPAALGSADGPATVEDVYPLSPMQEGMLFHTPLRAGGRPLRRAGQLPIWRARWTGAPSGRAWQAVVDRHPSLRTVVRLGGAATAAPGGAAAGRSCRWSEQDWRGLAAAEQEARCAGASWRADRARGFDLGAAAAACGSPWCGSASDAYRLRLEPTTTCCSTAGRCRCCSARCSRPTRRSPRAAEPRCAPSRPYRDYIAWLEQQDLGGGRGVLAPRRWPGFTAPTPLAAEHAGRRPGRPGSGRAPAATSGAAPAGADTAALAAPWRAARSSRSTPWCRGPGRSLLGRYGGEEDVVFGVDRLRPAAELRRRRVDAGAVHQHPAGARRACRPRAALLAVAARPPGAPARAAAATSTARSPRSRAGARCRGAAALREPAGLRELPRGRLAGRGGRRGGCAWTGWSASGSDQLPARPGRRPRRAACTCGSTTTPPASTPAPCGGCSCTSRPCSPAWPPPPPETRPADLPLLTAAERHQLLVEWNDAGSSVRGRPVHELFAAQAARTPDALAVAFERTAS